MSEASGGARSHARTHTQRNTGAIEPVCQPRYQLISVSANGKTDLQSVDAGDVLICRVLARLNIWRRRSGGAGERRSRRKKKYKAEWGRRTRATLQQRKSVSNQTAEII